jgi:AbrB family looped-hinge helix DNA binding protein
MALRNARGKTNSTARVGKGRQVVIPKRLCQDLGLHEGDLVEVRRTRGAVLIKPKTLVEPDDILTPQEAETVVKGEAELRRGEYVTLSQLHHDLDRPVVQRRRKTA